MANILVYFNFRKFFLLLLYFNPPLVKFLEPPSTTSGTLLTFKCHVFDSKSIFLQYVIFDGGMGLHLLNKPQ